MTRRALVACLLAAAACRDSDRLYPSDVVQLRVEGREWTESPSPAFTVDSADQARLGLLYTDMVAAFAVVDAVAALASTSGDLIVGSSSSGVLSSSGASPWVIEAAQGRDLLTTGQAGVEFMGGPCDDGFYSLCFRGIWRYHQPGGETVIIGSVGSDGTFISSCPMESHRPRRAPGTGEPVLRAPGANGAGK